MRVRGGAIRDRCPGGVGLARPLACQPARAGLRLCHLCRLLEEPRAHPEGKTSISRFEYGETRTVRSFCARCGTPLFYERPHAPKMVNIPRAVFAARTGREPALSCGLERSSRLGLARRPLKGFPGVMWERPGEEEKGPGGRANG